MVGENDLSKTSGIAVPTMQGGDQSPPTPMAGPMLRPLTEGSPKRGTSIDSIPAEADVAFAGLSGTECDDSCLSAGQGGYGHDGLTMRTGYGGPACNRSPTRSHSGGSSYGGTAAWTQQQSQAIRSLGSETTADLSGGLSGGASEISNSPGSSAPGLSSSGVNPNAVVTASCSSTTGAAAVVTALGGTVSSPSLLHRSVLGSADAVRGYPAATPARSTPLVTPSPVPRSSSPVSTAAATAATTTPLVAESELWRLSSSGQEYDIADEESFSSQCGVNEEAFSDATTVAAVSIGDRIEGIRACLEARMGTQRFQKLYRSLAAGGGAVLAQNGMGGNCDDMQNLSPRSASGDEDGGEHSRRPSESEVNALAPLVAKLVACEYSYFS